VFIAATLALALTGVACNDGPVQPSEVVCVQLWNQAGNRAGQSDAASLGLNQAIVSA
jgi:hypothetical protein